MTLEVDIRPNIAVFFRDTTNPDFVRLRYPYLKAIEKAGGCPVSIVLEHGGPIGLLTNIAGFDGVLIPGGPDIHPKVYGMPAGKHTVPGDIRDDRHNVQVARQSIDLGIPILGICRGAQVLGVSMGGRLNQHVEEDPGFGRHDRFPWFGYRPEDLAHDVGVKSGSLLQRIVGELNMSVNSLHHQALEEGTLSGCTRAIAHSPDGLVEAIQVVAHPFALGVQWHPEHLISHDAHMAIFEDFLRAAAERRALEAA